MAEHHGRGKGEGRAPRLDACGGAEAAVNRGDVGMPRGEIVTPGGAQAGLLTVLIGRGSAIGVRRG